MSLIKSKTGIDKYQILMKPLTMTILPDIEKV
jgi:hypothetical protein